MTLSNFKDALSTSVYGMSAREAISLNICISCKKTPTFKSDAGRREYPISGLCEPCFDDIFKDNEEGKE